MLSPGPAESSLSTINREVGGSNPSHGEWAVVAQLVRALKRGFSHTRPGLDFLYRQLYTVFVVGADRYLFSDNLRVGGSIPPCGLTGRSSSVVEQQAYNGYLVTRSNHTDLERCTNGRVGRFSVIGIAEIAQPVRAPTKVGGPGFKSQFYTPRVNNTFVHLRNLSLWAGRQRLWIK